MTLNLSWFCVVLSMSLRALSEAIAGVVIVLPGVVYQGLFTPTYLLRLLHFVRNDIEFIMTLIYDRNGNENQPPVKARNNHPKNITLKKITPPTINIKPNSKATTNNQSAFFPTGSGEPK
jgi:hypothetical protein